MNEKLIHQHGDVLLFKLSCLPNGLQKVQPQNRKYILAEGEATGHAHVIPNLTKCDVYADSDGNLFLDVRSTVELRHEEHATQRVKRGTYRVGRVREIDPFSEEIERVRD